MTSAAHFTSMFFIVFVVLGNAQEVSPQEHSANKIVATAQSNLATASRQKESSDNAPSVLAENRFLTNEESGSKAEQKMAWKKGNNLYNKNAYAEAIPYFKKALQSDSLNHTLLSRLGDCFRLTKNTEGKLYCYGTLVRLGTPDVLHELYYAQALSEKGEVEKAKLYFQKYGTDCGDKNIASSFGKHKTYTRNSDAYSLGYADFNSANSEMCAVKYQDQIVFASSRSNTSWISNATSLAKGAYMNVYTTKKETDGKHKTPGKFISALNTKYHDGPVSFNVKENKIYYTTNSSKNAEKGSDGTFKLRLQEAELIQNKLTNITVPAFINKNYNYAHPSVSADGKIIYFASDMEGGKGGMDIYRSEKDATGQWGPPVNVGELINTAGTEAFPFVSANGALFFSSNGLDGMGGMDIYEAKIRDQKVVAVYNMGQPVNTAFDDFGLFFDDNSEGFVSSNRKSAGMDEDIYHFKIQKEVRRGKDIVFLIKEKETRIPLSNASLVINGDTLYANSDGEIITMVEEGLPLSITALRDDYFQFTETIVISGTQKDAVVKELLLEKNPKLFLRGLVQDARTNELLEGVKIRITDIAGNHLVDEYTTTQVGDYFKLLPEKRLGDQLDLQIILEKENYLPRTLLFSHKIVNPGEINLNQYLNLSLGKIEVGMDLAKMIDVKPIHLDPDKPVITADAAAELDKIVVIMKKHNNLSIEVGSHTDCRSSAIGNMKRSAGWAKACVEYIVNKGIPKERVSGRGYGETNLLNNCACEGKLQSSCPEEEHLKNQRTEFLITKIN